MKASGRILTFLASLMAIGLIASAGLAVTRPMASVGEIEASEWEAAATCDDEGPAVPDGHAADAETDAPDADVEVCDEEGGAGEASDQPPAEEGGSGGTDVPDEEEPGAEEPGAGEPGDVEPDDAVDPAREAACNEAAGVAPAPAGDDPADPAGEKAHGLENAIGRVLANCTSNPRAPGLLVALRHLVANKAKHDAHEDARAEARAKAKAKAKQAPRGVGSPADREWAPPGQSEAHGNGRAAGPSASHGAGNGHGGSTSQGNPHGG